MLAMLGYVDGELVHFGDIVQERKDAALAFLTSKNILGADGKVPDFLTDYGLYAAAKLETRRLESNINYNRQYIQTSYEDYQAGVERHLCICPAEGGSCNFCDATVKTGNLCSHCENPVEPYRDHDVENNYCRNCNGPIVAAFMSETEYTESVESAKVELERITAEYDGVVNAIARHEKSFAEMYSADE